MKDDGGSEQAIASLTVRDYFAAAAMAAIITKDAVREESSSTVRDSQIAAGAYDYADAMIKERAK